jgi:hypothetical protein
MWTHLPTCITDSLLKNYHTNQKKKAPIIREPSAFIHIYTSIISILESKSFTFLDLKIPYIKSLTPIL